MRVRNLENLFKGEAVRKYKKGQIIIYADDELSNVYLLKQGFIKVYSPAERGESKILLIFSPPATFPILMDMLVEIPHYKMRYSYEAMSDVEVLVMTKEKFYRRLQEDAVTRMVMAYVNDLTFVLASRLSMIENKDAKSKILGLMRYLLDVAGERVSGGKYEIGVKITHNDIAALTGISRETASTQMKKLENQKLVQHKKGGILVLDKKFRSVKNI